MYRCLEQIATTLHTNVCTSVVAQSYIYVIFGRLSSLHPERQLRILTAQPRTLPVHLFDNVRVGGAQSRSPSGIGGWHVQPRGTAVESG